MAAILLTSRTLRGLKATGLQSDFFDRAFTAGSFGVRVFASGVKTFFYLYRNSRGQRRRLQIGDASLLSLAEARDRARKIAVEVSNGEDPAQNAREYRAAATVEEVCKDYVEIHAKPNKRPSSVAEDERIIQLDILPRWGRFKATDIRRRDVIALLDEIRVQRSAPVMANRTRALLHKIFSFALDREIVETNPCAGLPRVAKERSRERFLSTDEIAKLLQVLNADPDVRMRSLFKLILLTGQRPGEIMGMRWNEIQGNLWTLPPERTKNGCVHTVPLSPHVLEILATLRSYNQVTAAFSRKNKEKKEYYDSFVFPSRYGGHVTEIHHKCKRVVEAMGVPDWRPHDLRRTFATQLEEMGISTDVIERAQNHRKPGMAQIYQRGDRRNEVAQAMLLWGKHVQQLAQCQQPPLKIVAFG